MFSWRKWEVKSNQLLLFATRIWQISSAFFQSQFLTIFFSIINNRSLQVYIEMNFFFFFFPPLLSLCIYTGIFAGVNRYKCLIITGGWDWMDVQKGSSNDTGHMQERERERRKMTTQPKEKIQVWPNMCSTTIFHFSFFFVCLTFMINRLKNLLKNYRFFQVKKNQWCSTE